MASLYCQSSHDVGNGCFTLDGCSATDGTVSAYGSAYNLCSLKNLTLPLSSLVAALFKLALRKCKKPAAKLQSCPASFVLAIVIAQKLIKKSKLLSNAPRVSEMSCASTMLLAISS